MRRTWIPLTHLVCACGLLAALAMPAAAGEKNDKEEGFESIFDGKTLEKWDGNPKFWSVQDGCLTGQTTADNPTNGNTFIIWRGGEVGDFELKLEYKIVGGNSGIQYRSFEVPNQKWVIGGYQADFEAGDTYSGILYGERFRGILANRGQKTVINDEGKPEVVGTVGQSAEIQKAIKKEDWNEYHITAKGYHFVHKINGVTTCEATDEDDDTRRAKGVLALQLHAGPPMKVQFRNIRLKKLGGEKEGGAEQPGDTSPKPKNSSTSAKKGEQTRPRRVAFVAGTASHGFGSHEHKAGCTLLAKALEKAMPNFQVMVYTGGWPKDPNALEGFDCIVMYSDGGGGHMVNRNLEQVDKLMKQGVGLVCIHYAVEVPKGEPGDKFLNWIGGYFETDWSVNPHWTAEFKELPEHPITRGVRPFEINDEWYYHMRFRKDMEGVTPILSAVPPASTLNRPDGPHSNNPHVRKTLGQPQHVAWAAVREDGGRGFGFTGGHNHWNWGNNNFRQLVLNAIVWTAKGEVPEHGVPLQPVTVDDLMAEQDFPPPENFNKEKIQEMLNAWNQSPKEGVKKE